MMYAVVILGFLLLCSLLVILCGVIENHKIRERHKKELADASRRWTKTRYYVRTQHGKQALGTLLSIISSEAFNDDPVTTVIDIDMLGVPKGTTLEQFNKVFPSYKEYTTGEASRSESCTIHKGDFNGN